MSFICHIYNYTEYNQQWNVFSAFNSSKCTHTWSSGQPTLWRPGSSRGFGALFKGLISVMDNSCWSRDSNPQHRITSPTLYPLGHDCLLDVEFWLCLMEVQPEEHCSSPAWKWQGPGQEVVQHALSERAWSFWCCVVQSCKIEQSL